MKSFLCAAVLLMIFCLIAPPDESSGATQQAQKKIHYVSYRQLFGNAPLGVDCTGGTGRCCVDCCDGSELCVVEIPSGCTCLLLACQGIRITCPGCPDKWGGCQS